jgi:uncharacterized protein
MKRYAKISELPDELPLFPLAGALLLPRADLPLNIFEPRYLAMIDHALSHARMIGMIQPLPGDDSATPELARIGCAGRIVSYAETQDNRMLITLTGVCRFELKKELKSEELFRSAKVVYKNFAADLVSESGAQAVDRPAVIKAFRQYLEANNMTANWEEVEQVSTEQLVNTLSQMAPYPAPEKQALLEARDLASRADMLVALTELALAGGSGNRSRLQ